MVAAPYISWEITDACNHNCFYCYNYWRSDKDRVYKQNIDYDRICRFIIEQHPVWVSITGGEPLLEWDRVKVIIKQFWANGIGIRLVTNGSCITEEIAGFLAKYQVQVMVSFPSSDCDVFFETTERKTYGAVIKGMDTLKSCGVDFTQNIVVTAKNLDSLQNTVEFLFGRYGIKRLFISRATRPVNASTSLQNELLNKSSLQRMFNICVSLQEKYNIHIRACGGFPFCAISDSKIFEMFAKGCGAGEAGYVISGNGDVRACARDCVSHGNIFQTPIEEIWSSIKRWSSEDALPEECRTCNVKEACRGGCRMASKEGVPSYNNLDLDADPGNQPVLFNNYNEKCMSRRIGADLRKQKGVK